MALFFHSSIASPVMAECACASLVFTSFTDVLSLVCVEPKYLNWSTSSSVCPFICMLVDGLGLMLLTRILLFSELISMPYSAAVSSSLLFCALCTVLYKLPGVDDIPAEILKHGGPGIIDALTVVCQKIWTSGQWPKDWTKSLIIPLPKKRQEYIK